MQGKRTTGQKHIAFMNMYAAAYEIFRRGRFKYIVATRGNEKFPVLLPTGYRPSVVGNLKVLKNSSNGCTEMYPETKRQMSHILH